MNFHNTAFFRAPGETTTRDLSREVDARRFGFIDCVALTTKRGGGRRDRVGEVSGVRPNFLSSGFSIKTARAKNIFGGL